MTRDAPSRATERAADYPADALRLPHTDWLRHALAVSGPCDEVTDFRAAASGAGAIPWCYPDLDQDEENRLYALLHPPDGSPGMKLSSARVLARLLREAIEAGQQRAADPGGRAKACPFDLHALIPAPSHILQLGPDDPMSVAWLRTHWGVVQTLRHVRLHDAPTDRRKRRSLMLCYEFWSADWSPWQALARLKTLYPALVFDLRPDYRRE